jgi:hypothetical protein
MKKIASLFLSVCCLCFAAAVYSQSPAPESDTLKDPVKQGDPAPENPPPINYKADQVRIMSQDIPAAIRQTLESNPEYEGWKKATIYKNRANSLYTVEFKEADKTRIFRFDKSGKPVVER